MSEQINNRQYRKQVIKEIIAELHQGKDVEQVREKFQKAFDGVSATEISEAETALIAEGIPVEEVQRLCDVHAAVFKGSIQEIHQAETQQHPADIPGHPVNVLKAENRLIQALIDSKIKPYLNSLPQLDSFSAGELKEALSRLEDVGIHYARKENLLFPYMEKYGITAPPQVMWGVDDEIRQQIKEVVTLFNTEGPAAPGLKEKLEAAITKVEEMIFKEENIMLPMLLELLTQDEWKSIADQSHEIGFLLDTVPVWNPAPEQAPKVEQQMAEPDAITLPTGVLKVSELTHLLNTLPFDITFVDKDDVVKYFSQGQDRIFARTKAVIGRNVANCHPPASVHVVQKIVEDFKSGRKDHEDFWIRMGDRYVYIRYFAVRDQQGQYLGVLEVTQDIKPIQEITGEKRLVSD